MWSSNVLRLRGCSSAATVRHGLNRRWYSSEKSLPVGAKEFEDALARVLKRAESKEPLGFAISGGVDSMALAALYSKLHPSEANLPKTYGFIVDHKVRKESTEEAEWVAEQLRSKFHMRTAVIPLTWPEGYDLNDTKRFETDARTLRYQALGRACKLHGIPTLLLAHHADDQAETVMMRLMNNRLRSGLQAMQSVEWIPECYGIHGVHHSGHKQSPSPDLDIPFPVEKGGIQILRPLLGFEKSRLIATCEEQGVPWAEDKTNAIQTVTSRNAIRHVFKNHKLPAALSVKSLVNVSFNMQQRVESHKAFAEKLFNECPIKLDIQTGSLLVRFPPVESLLDRPIKTDSDRKEATNNAYFLLERVAEFVTPKPNPPLSQLAGTVVHIYPELRDSEDVLNPENQGRPKSYSVYGIWWRPWDKASPFDDCPPADDSVFSAPKNTDTEKAWLLTRQPPDVDEKKDPKNQIFYAPANTPTWQLFDGRYWIRLRNRTQDTLILRVFAKEDVKYLNSTKPKTSNSTPDDSLSGRFITAAFSLFKPSDIRFTLPAVFRKDSTTGKESLIGFPTLNVRMYHVDAPKEGSDACEWRVRYKKLDFGQRSPGHIIVPGTSRFQIVATEARQRSEQKGEKFVLRRGFRVVDERLNDPLTGYKRVSGDRIVTARHPVRRQKEKNHEQLGGKYEDYDGLRFLRREGKGCA